MGFTEGRALYNLQSPDKAVAADDEKKDNNIKDNQKSRLTRFIIYWIALGVFLDIAIYYARFRRTDSSHDEFHAAIMMLSFLTALGMDIWFLVTNYSRLFKGDFNVEIYFYLICASNVLALPQLGRLRSDSSVR